MPRQDQEAIAVHAKQLLDDELLKAAFDAVESEVVRKIREANINGSQESADYVLELARKLQTVEGVRGFLRAKVQNQSILDYNQAQKRRGA